MSLPATLVASAGVVEVILDPQSYAEGKRLGRQNTAFYYSFTSFSGSREIACVVLAGQFLAEDAALLLESLNKGRFIPDLVGLEAIGGEDDEETGRLDEWHRPYQISLTNDEHCGISFADLAAKFRDAEMHQEGVSLTERISQLMN